MLDPIVSLFFTLFLRYTNLCDLFSEAPSVNFCLKNSIKMRASCLFFIKKLFFDLTNAISTAGALY